MRFSIVTCFHNSEKRLASYFGALEKLEIAGHDLEFVFVDNASRDGTAEGLREQSAHLAAPVTIVTEPQPGLMYARCAGIAAARGTFILFLDDDNEPAPNYINELERLRTTYDGAAMITGNVVLPADYSVHAGSESAVRLLVVRELDGEFEFELDEMQSPYFPWGAAMFARRTDFAEACEQWKTGDQKIVGRVGAGLGGGEDVWIAHFITRSNRRVVFSDRLRIIHRFDQDRLHPSYMGRLAFENGLGYLAHLAEVAAIKNTVSPPRTGADAALRAFFVRVPYRLLRFMIHRDIDSLTEATMALGHAYALMNQQVDATTRRK